MRALPGGVGARSPHINPATFCSEPNPRSKRSYAVRQPNARGCGGREGEVDPTEPNTPENLPAAGESVTRQFLFWCRDIFFIVHHAGMITLYQTGINDVAGGFVDKFLPDFAAAEPDAVFLHKVFIAAQDVISSFQRVFGAEFGVEILFSGTDDKLKGLTGVVFYPVIQIVVTDAGPDTERNLSPEIRKEIDPVVMVVFNNIQR